MFESDDFDQVLSQLDFPEVSGEKHVPSIDNALKTTNISSISFPTINTSKNVDTNDLHWKENIHCSVSNKKSTSPTYIKKKIIDSHFDHKNKRKFPGPAGLLVGNCEETKDDSMCQIELLSQDIDSSQHLQKGIFHTPLWSKLQEDTSNLNYSTIKIIKQQALAGNLRKRKADVVRGFVDSIDRSAIDPLFTLRDPTGHIKCTLHRDAWTYFSTYIASECCALVLQRTTVLTTGSAFKKHYLNVTLYNISHIYSNNIVQEEIELPDGFVKIVNGEFTLIKCDRPITDLQSNEEIENNILEGLDGEFADIF
ncbi:unnamed protein product [Leptosia nina]|uniref:Homologous recombination OB-fold protein OB-fold domain-containing protein n=1 Tax=Leptosia nina TaxID=320188 RepID=A0AAV1K3R3_9NEOP